MRTVFPQEASVSLSQIIDHRCETSPPQCEGWSYWRDRISHDFATPRKWGVALRHDGVSNANSQVAQSTNDERKFNSQTATNAKVWSLGGSGPSRHAKGHPRSLPSKSGVYAIAYLLYTSRVSFFLGSSTNASNMHQ